MMEAGWDVIVIGSGVGGLTAAAKLVQAGKRVLVLERNPHPGGTAYVYHRSGFSFPMGPLGFSNPGIVGDILGDFSQRSHFKCQRVRYRLRSFDLDIPLSLPFSEMVGELRQYFPNESGAIKEFFECMAVLQSPTTGNHLIEAKGRAQTSAAEYLQRAIRDWRLRRILGSLGTREPYSSLPLLAAMWSLMSQEGIWHPEEGIQSVSGKLAQAVTGHGAASMLPERPESTGTIRLRAEVKKIRVEKGKASGVILADGTALDSASVVSNADYKTTFLELLDPNSVPPKWYRAVSQARQTGSVLQVCLGVNESRVDLSAFKEATRLIYRRGHGDFRQNEEILWNETEVDPKAIAGLELEVSLWSKENPNVSPVGGAVIVIRTEAPYSHFARFRLERGVRIPTYHNYKVQLAAALIDELRHLIPGLDDAILVMDVATPLTFRDRSGRSEGTVAGWSWDYEDSRDFRPRELVLTPIKGLYMAGYQAFSALFMGGVPTAMVSGCRAAQALLDNADPIEEVTIPGTV
jgi:all-trans-retinol 13,14-reductase